LGAPQTSAPSGVLPRCPQLGGEISDACRPRRPGVLVAVSLAALAIELGPDRRPVDIGVERGLASKDRYVVVGHGQEPAASRRLDPGGTARGALRHDPHNAALGEDAQYRRMTGQHANVAV